MHRGSTWDMKSFSEDHKLRKNPRNPSFSSSLLDEIYRSIDDGDEKCKELKIYRERASFKNNQCINGGIKAVEIEDEEIRSLRKACLINKWMETKVNTKVPGRRTESTMSLSFSSGSSSSDSSFSNGFSSSETESFGARVKSTASCFAAPRPKPVRTSCGSGPGRSKKAEVNFLKNGHSQREFCLFDNYQHNHDDYQTNRIEECLIKSKTRAQEIYANLKKVKQPISPGGRLTAFINSFFTNGNSKKMSKDSNPQRGYKDPSFERKIKSTQTSACSSASSFSRSCLNKNSPRSREKKSNNGVKRTVRFYPFSVIVDEDCRPCGQKSIYDQESENFGRSRMTANAEMKLHLVEDNWKIAAAAIDSSKELQNRLKNDLRNVQDDDDAASDSSSDLFELDHVAFFGNNRFCEELPVYGTTHLNTNRVIASGLIC